MDAHIFERDFLRDGVKAFVDSHKHFLSDIPLRYVGLRMLRTLTNPNMNSFVVELTVPCVVYIASPLDQRLPLTPTKEHPWTTHDADENITLLTGVDATGRAIESKTLGVRFIVLRAPGEIKFNVAHTAVPFVLFVEGRRQSAFSCGGCKA